MLDKLRIGWVRFDTLPLIKPQHTDRDYLFVLSTLFVAVRQKGVMGMVWVCR